MTVNAFFNRIWTISGIAVATIALGAAPTIAQTFKYTTTGEWGPATTLGGTDVEYRVVNGESQVLWGDPSATARTGLGFTGASFEAALGSPFVLGIVRYTNQPIPLESLVNQVPLVLSLDFGDSLPISTQSFTFDLAVDETANLDLAACIYPSTVPCADKISWINPIPGLSFEVGDVVYILQLLGFSPTEGQLPVNSFIAQEQTDNLALLYGRVIGRTLTKAPIDEIPTSDQPLLPPVTPAPGQAVPEPATVVGIFLAGLGLAAARCQRDDR